MPLTHVLHGSRRTLLSMVADLGIPILTARRHMSVLRSCIGPSDRPLVVAPCGHADRLHSRVNFGSCLLLTRHRLIVTSERGLLRRLRLHLNVNLHQLTDVAWTPEPDANAVHLAATVMDGIREHFWIRLGAPELVWRLDGLLREAFSPKPRRRPLAMHRPRAGHVANAA